MGGEALKAKIGVVGLAVMGQNLVLNIEGKGHAVVAYNRTADRTRALAERSRGRKVHPAYSLEGFVKALERPRAVLVMVKAGPAVDEVLEELYPLLDEGDVVIDGGNSHFADTERRLKAAEERGLFYLGTGISGGESGALHGPSIMVGGHRQGYEQVEALLESIAARGPEGACCGYLGPGSAGHYVKMIHNGIEYAIMETLAEAYDLMKRGLGMSPAEMADTLADWNRGDLGSYLVEITERVLRETDPETGRPLVELIVDTAQQKGTGKWSSQSALDIGSPTPTIAASVFARMISAIRAERIEAEKVLTGPAPRLEGDRRALLEEVQSAVYLTTVAAYAQGFRQLRDASRERGYNLNLAEVARVWMAGCIIRAKLLAPIRDALAAEAGLPLLLLAQPFLSDWNASNGALRHVVIEAHARGIPVPAMSSALDFVDAYRTGRLPANLTQAQRDYFGSHTYERLDRPGTFHTRWEAA